MHAKNLRSDRELDIQKEGGRALELDLLEAQPSQEAPVFFFTKVEGEKQKTTSFIYYESRQQSKEFLRLLALSLKASLAKTVSFLRPTESPCAMAHTRNKVFIPDLL